MIMQSIHSVNTTTPFPYLKGGWYFWKIINHSRGGLRFFCQIVKMGRIHTGKVVYRSVCGGRGGGGKHCFSLMVYIVHSNNGRYSACLSFTIFFSFESFWYLRSLSKMTHPVQLPMQAKKQDKRVMRVKVGSNGEKKELDKIWKIGGGGGG